MRRSSIYGGGPPRSAVAVLLESHLAAAASQPVGALLPGPDWPRCSGTAKEARGGGEGDGEHGGQRVRSMRQGRD